MATFFCAEACSTFSPFCFFTVCIKAEGLPLDRLCMCVLACTRLWRYYSSFLGVLFGSRLSLQQHIGPQNLVNDLSIEREIAPNLFSFKHISFPFISSGIILHEWILCHRNIHAANVAAIVRYCIYTCCQNIRKFMDNREFIANRVQSVSPFRFLFFFPLDVILLLVRLKKITVSLPSFPFFSVVSPLPAQRLEPFQHTDLKWMRLSE